MITNEKIFTFTSKWTSYKRIVIVILQFYSIFFRNFVPHLLNIALNSIPHLIAGFILRIVFADFRRYYLTMSTSISKVWMRLIVPRNKCWFSTQIPKNPADIQIPKPVRKNETTEQQKARYIRVVLMLSFLDSISSTPIVENKHEEWIVFRFTKRKLWENLFLIFKYLIHVCSTYSMSTKLWNKQLFIC